MDADGSTTRVNSLSLMYADDSTSRVNSLSLMDANDSTTRVLILINCRRILGDCAALLLSRLKPRFHLGKELEIEKFLCKEEALLFMGLSNIKTTDHYTSGPNISCIITDSCYVDFERIVKARDCMHRYKDTTYFTLDDTESMYLLNFKDIRPMDTPELNDVRERLLAKMDEVIKTLG